MEWSPELCMKLIDEYRKYPILWNAKHPFHFSRNDKLIAWNKISGNLKVSVADVKQKMNSLLGSLRREKAKGKVRVETDLGVKEVYVSKWFAFKQMSFLLERNEPMVKIKGEVESVEDQTNFDDYDHLQFIDVIYKNENNQHSPPSEEATSGYNETEHFLSYRQPNYMKRETDMTEEDARCEEVYNILKETLAAATDDAHPCSVYGRHVANKLRTYTDRTRAEVEHSINQILYEADIGKYDAPNAKPSPKTSPNNHADT